jgi:hypothetical protein
VEDKGGGEGRMIYESEVGKRYEAQRKVESGITMQLTRVL